MKVLFLCGIFAEENEQEVVENSKSYVEFSANLFQRKLINGFKNTDCDLSVISAPFIGAYPFRCKKMSFKGFKEHQDKYTYIKFNNIWGLRNFSRSRSAKKALKSFIQDPCKEKLIVAYSAHTPFLKAAVYAKRKNPSIKVCLYTPDLPDYMNLDVNKSSVYSFAKKYDIKAMHKQMREIDSFVLLTEHMKNRLPIADKPYLVKEGIISASVKSSYRTTPSDTDIENNENNENNLKIIVYTGKLNEKFGIKNLVNSFKYLPDSNYRLVLCGTGDCAEFVKDASEKDKRIIATGQITPDEAKEWQDKAAVLINPRENNEEYTKYSFPSKNIDYLLSGKPVAAYILSGMPKIYKEFLYAIDENEPADRAIADVIVRALGDSDSERNVKYEEFYKYASENITAESIARSIIKLNF